MNITIEIEGSEINLKKAIAKGWNAHYDERLTHKDIRRIFDKEDILRMIPYLDDDSIEILNIK